jgi:integrase
LDATEKGHAGLASDYTERGETPRVWKGSGMKRPRVTRHEASNPTPDQVRAVLSAAEGTRYAPLFTLLVNTGLRRGEALAPPAR